MGELTLKLGPTGAGVHAFWGADSPSAMNMGATERYRSRFQRCTMALCDREGLSGSTHGSRLVCLRGIRAIVALWRFGRPDNPEDGRSVSWGKARITSSVLAITRSQNRARF